MLNRDASPLYAELNARIEDIVGAWRAALAPTSYVPLSATEQHEALTHLTRALIDVLLAERFAPADAAPLGAELVKIGYTRPAALGRTLEVFGRELTAGLNDSELRQVQSRLAPVLAELGTGFANQITERILAEQETIREALLTQRDLAEQAMRESEARFRAIFEASPFGIAVADMQGRILTANPTLERMVGFSEDEMRGHVILAEFAHPEDAEAGYRAFLELAEGRTDQYEIEQRFFTRDGRAAWVQLAMALVRDAEGRPQFA